MKRWPLPAAVLLVALTGCAPPGTYSKVRSAIRDAVTKDLGPADSYDVDVTHDSPSSLLAGHIRRVTVRGVNVRPKPGYYMDDLTMDATDVRFNRKKKAVEGAGETVVTAVISEPSLAKMVEFDGKLHNPVVHIYPDNAVAMTGEAYVGPLHVRVGAHGIMEIVPPATIRFTTDHVSAEGVTLPFSLNKSIDFAQVYAPLLLTGIRSEPGRIIGTGTIDWSKRP